jgi:hypothetical protein
MMMEHKIVVGLKDIKAVTLACNNARDKCSIRLSLSPDDFRIPPQMSRLRRNLDRRPLHFRIVGTFQAGKFSGSIEKTAPL